LPVPGAAVTAEKGTQSLTVITDQQGAYTFPDLADGAWNIRAEMLGFATAKQDVTVAAGAPATDLELKILPFSEIHAEVKTVAPLVTTAAPEGPSPAKPDPAKPAPAKGRGFQRTEVNATAKANDAPPPPAPTEANAQSSSDLSQKAADGLLVNGSVNNGAASPFAQFAAFGNGRRNGRSVYTGMFGFTLDNSTLNARSYSLTDRIRPSRITIA